MKPISIKETAGFIRNNDGFLVYCHAVPDADTIGSACALVTIMRSLGKKAFAYSVDGIPKKLDFLPVEGVFVPSPLPGLIPVSVDIAGPKMLGNAEIPLFALSIDHHKVNTIECERLCLLSDRIAAGEIVFMLADELGVALDRQLALYLYTAICSDSGGFKYDLTTAETMRYAARALETGIDFAMINRRLFESLTASQVALIRCAYNKLQLLCGGKYAIVVITKEEADECGVSDADFDCIYSVPREIEGVLASAVIRPKNGGAKVSFRSNADIDVAELAQRYGGGGHFHAAGLSLESGVEEAEALVKKIFSEL